jgi:hypothetical protein
MERLTFSDGNSGGIASNVKMLMLFWIMMLYLFNDLLCSECSVLESLGSTSTVIFFRDRHGITV